MKFPQLASLAATAAVLLQFGSFVQANPMFVEIPPAASHGNDASDATCKDVRITYPAGKEISFANNTNHVVTWDVPSTTTQVNLTLVGQDYVSYLNTFPAQKFASNVPFVLKNGAQPGEYHVRLATIGGNSAPCEVDSDTFEIKASTEPAPVQQEEQTKSDQKHDNKDWDSMLSQLGQYVDKDNDDDNSKEKSKSSSSHSNAASKDEKTESFDQYIKSLDMDYRPYINNNKDTESDVVTHKNSVEDDTPTAAASTNDEYFTNEDHRTHVDAHLNEELGQLTSDNGNEHADSPFFQGSGGAQTVNTDSSTTDDGEWATDEMPAPVNQWVDESSKEKGHENQGVWNEEMSELNGEHADSPFFQGSGGAQTVNQGSSTTADDGDWIVDEMPAPVNQWVDESSDVKDHSNEGAWIEEEVDPSTFAAAHANQDGEGWSEVTSDNNYASSDFDHSNVGTWIAQEIDDAPEPTTTTTPHVDDSSPQGWVAEEDAHSNESTDIPDHSNIGQWQAEEIDSDNDHLSSQYSHGNDKVADENDWVESESTHPDVAASGWQEDTSAHPDATGGWQEDTSAHPDANGWQEVSSTTHPNVAADGWQEESSITTHPDVAADGWQEEESASPAPHMDDNVLMYSAEELIN